MKTTLESLLDQNQPILTDGAMGTMLFAMGLQNGEAPELWNVEHPGKIRKVHQQYIQAGSQIILTNTFGGNRLRLQMHGLQDRASEINKAGATLARQEADAAQTPVIVGGSIGPTGSVLAPYGELEYEDAVEAFAEQAQALANGGVDVFWVETMFDLTEVKAAVEACQQVDSHTPIVATMTFDTHGRTMMGTTPEQAIQSIGELDVIAIGGNCGNGPEEIQTVIEKMRIQQPEAVLIAKSNAGMPHFEDDVPIYDATPDVMASYALTVHELGAQIIGACCGSTPNHIAAMASALGRSEALS